MNVDVSGKPELLAPAGQIESAYAAFAFGADAVYAGLSRFSARAEAANFTPESLEELIAYAHSLKPARRVYVALNTLVREDEWRDALETIHLCADLGADALIVQDLGVCRLARRHVPKLKLHASTQMALHDSAGVEAARELGFSRVTLARELTPDEIRAAALVPGIQVETFVHGALCYSYSGLSGLHRLRGMATASNKELDIAADWPLYALNKHAIRMLYELGMSRITFSPEDGLENIKALACEAGGSLAFLVFQDTPLFISATCPKAGGSSGKCACPEELGFVSSHNDELLAIMRDCLVSVTSERAMYRPESVAELSAAGVGWMRADFSWRPRTPSDVCRIWRKVRDVRAMPGTYVGNLHRGMT